METFVGGNQQAYATMAFPNVVEQCETDVSEIRAMDETLSCAVDACDLRVMEFLVGAISTDLMSAELHGCISHVCVTVSCVEVRLLNYIFTQRHKRRLLSFLWVSDMKP